MRITAKVALAAVSALWGCAVRADATAETGNGNVVADFLAKSTRERVAIIADLAEKSKFRNVVPRPEDGPPRFMAVDGVANMRDIGGWKGLGGRRVRYGRAYRSAAFDTGVTFRRGARAQYEYLFGLAPVTEEEKNDFKPSERTITDKGIDELLHDLGIRTDLDLRSPHECYLMESSPLGSHVKWFHCPLKTYGHFAEADAKEAFAKAFRVFLDESNYPIIFHCAGGADRTGAVAFMVNGICGVALDDLRKDWELTAFGTGHAENPGFTHARRFDRLVAVVDKMPGETLTDRIVAYVKSCGFTDADIARVREIMLTPEEGDAAILFKGAQWIGQPDGLGAAAPRFTTRFTVARGGPTEIAICGLGQYVATLNGKPLGCGDEFNLPGWTKTSKTCFYNVFGPVLKAGEENTLEITLGDGMYNVPSPGGDLYTKFTGSEGEKKLLVGGAVKSSPEGWTVSASEVVRTHVYSGDDIDRTADVARALPAVAAEAPKGVLREAPFVCRLQEVKKPVRTMRVSDEELTVDFGQNAAYVPTVVAKGPRGSCVEVEFAELPLAEGETRLPEEATTHRKGGVTRCRFTLAGTGADETFTTPFFYYGFRYLRVRLLPAQEGGERPAFVSAEARVVMADLPSAGSFACSIPLFNKIHEICVWAQRSNMQSVFTDCPHREKLGWQEEDHIHAEQIRWGWNADALFAKTCRDVADSQLEDGLCPCIAPEFVVFRPKFRDSIEWGSSVIQIPRQQYEWTGDDSLIRRYWTNMVAYHNYIRSQAQDFIARGGLGDWCQETAGGTRPVRRTSNALTATAFYYQNAVTLARFAAMLGRDGEAAAYRDEAEQIKKAFNAKWWRPDLHGYENNSQAANALALAFGLADESERTAIVSNIVEDVRGRGNAVGTGEIGYPYLLKVLSENGHDDVIFDMTADDTKPGYGWMIAKGNTSCHEAWDARPELSHNHFMMADIVNWFYGSLAGIRRTSPGFRTFTVEPKFLPGLDWVKASHRVAGGEIKVEWMREGATICVMVAVPKGTTATVRLPGMGDVVQTPGEETYRVFCGGCKTMWNEPVKWREGATIRAYALEEPQLMKAYVARVDLTTPGIGFASTGRAPDWGRQIEMVTNRVCLAETVSETTADFMTRNRAEGRTVELAFNTAPWLPWPMPKGCEQCDPMGLCVADGVEVSRPDSHPVFVVRKDGSADILPAPPSDGLAGLAFASSAFDLLLTNGVDAVTVNRREDEGCQPRLALGLTPDKRTLVVVAVDGRQPGYSIGATMADLRAIFRREGVSDAVNMDGGGSTSLVVWDGRADRPVMLNHQKGGYARKNAVNFGISFATQKSED